MLPALFPPHKAAIFDLDGTLLESMWVWQRVDLDFFAARGLRPPEDYAETIHSMTFREVALYTVERFALPESPEEVMREWNERSLRFYRDEVKLKPGAREYLEALRAKRVKLAVATNLTTHMLETVLQSNGVFHLFDALSSADEVSRGKRFPDIYLLTARKLGIAPCDCVAFDDVAAALLGIRAAGMTACAVLEPASRQDWDEMRRLAPYAVTGFAE
ncbi:MAG: HAD family phosphatase [Oscillospiraceae bacterium]|jgi:HAD superfamily hydrolase (TIGR01509 family)|nr:HAD family phosphatase [Oscillospiraceae bacterium]